jgi:hypothetical protein
MTPEIETIIAKRTFRHINGHEVVLLIGMPRKFSEDETDYFCEFQVKGLGDEQVRRSGGIDALQALILGVQRAAMYVESHDAVKQGKVTWIEGSSDLGLSF